MSADGLLLVVRMRRIGMRMPVRTLLAARSSGLPVALACSILMQETGGGRNEFGHDPGTVAAGWGQVTRKRYAAYVQLRDMPTHGAHCQGVGPCQLTAVSFQDEADRLGGCWRPLVNMRVGFSALAANVRRDGIERAVAAYNGSGPAAQEYARAVLDRAATYEKMLKGRG